MKALWLSEKQLSLRVDVPLPTLDSDEVLIKVLLAGICSTDLEMVRGYYPFTGIPGHEFVGVVVNANGDAELEGKRVIGDINIACGVCERCLDLQPHHCLDRRTLGIFNYNGVFAEYVKLPVRNLYLVPDKVSDIQACFSEPVAAALRILDQVHITPSHSVIVVGAGRLGLLIAQVIRNTGCDLKVVVRRPEIADILEKMRIRSVYPDQLKPGQADIVIEATGSPEGFELSRSLTRAGGTLVMKSTIAEDVRINLSKLVVDEVSIVGSRCGNMESGLRALASGLVQVEELVDSVYTLDQGKQAFTRASQPAVLKVFIKP